MEEGLRWTYLIVLPDLADDVVEGVVDVDAGFGGGFDEFAAEGAGEVATLFS